MNPGVGLRVFSGERRNSTVASLGLDYMFRTRNWLGSAGYFGMDLGQHLNRRVFDFGVGVGGTKTVRSGRGGAVDKT